MTRLYRFVATGAFAAFVAVPTSLGTEAERTQFPVVEGVEKLTATAMMEEWEEESFESSSRVGLVDGQRVMLMTALIDGRTRFSITFICPEGYAPRSYTFHWWGDEMIARSSSLCADTTGRPYDPLSPFNFNPSDWMRLFDPLPIRKPAEVFYDQAQPKLLV